MKILNFFIISAIKGLSFLPLRFLYFMSDGFYYLLYYVIKYRKNVVYANLNNSFPDKTEKEIEEIAKEFYRHFADMILEIIKSYSWNIDDYTKHVTYKNFDEFNKLHDEDKSIVILTSHFGNWEWWIFAPYFLKHKLLIVYQPLGNKLFDRFLNGIRSKFGGEMLPLKNTFRSVLNHQQKEEKTITWICADQTPPRTNTFWVNFLHQPTSFYNGGEKISRKTGQQVYFFDVMKEGRGKYSLEFKKYTGTPEESSPNQISIAYAKYLEELIHRQPSYWLWSHKRWKHKIPEGVTVHNR
ncbi:MAG: lysophospholipid acyltransferase family protein [Cyclobacteriaceae bacterium]